MGDVIPVYAIFLAVMDSISKDIMQINYIEFEVLDDLACKEVRHQLVKAKNVAQEVDVIQKKASTDVVRDWHCCRPDDKGIARKDAMQIVAETLQILFVRTHRVWSISVENDNQGTYPIYKLLDYSVQVTNKSDFDKRSVLSS